MILSYKQVSEKYDYFLQCKTDNIQRILLNVIRLIQRYLINILSKITTKL